MRHRDTRRHRPSLRLVRNERGVTLLEAVVAILIILSVTLAVAFTFSTGKGNLEHLAWRRAALAQAQLRLEQLLHNPAPADTTATATSTFDANHQCTTVVTHPGPGGLVLDGVRTATESWTIWYEDDPVDGLASAGTDAYPWDNKRVREVIWWTVPGHGNDTVTVESVLPPPMG